MQLLTSSKNYAIKLLQHTKDTQLSQNEYGAQIILWSISNAAESCLLNMIFFSYH